MSSVQPAQTNERTTNVVDSSRPNQTQVYEVHHDSRYLCAISEKAVTDERKNTCA